MTCLISPRAAKDEASKIAECGEGLEVPDRRKRPKRSDGLFFVMMII